SPRSKLSISLIYIYAFTSRSIPFWLLNEMMNTNVYRYLIHYCFYSLSNKADEGNFNFALNRFVILNINLQFKILELYQIFVNLFMTIYL
ncbi:Uncharacterized protein APZ42_010252, partial [Daphnia magna]